MSFRIASAAAIAALGGLALAQGNLKSRLAPITGPIRQAGVYHLATGTWTRHASVANVTGPDTSYNNTCSALYYAKQAQNERYSHRSCVPSPTHPVVPTVVPGGTGNDESFGCQSSYVVNGFQFAYCTGVAGTVDWQLGFQEIYTLCGGSNGGMTPTQVFNLTGMPGGSPTAPNCWIIDVDLNAASLSFSMLADGTGTYTPPSTTDQFGWSWMPTSAVGSPSSTGPVVAGNFTWLGSPTTGPLTPCQGTDGTIWDSPINLAEAGTGMTSNDFFRADGPGAAFPGCHFFGGTPHADFWLELYSASPCPACSSCTPSLCDPGSGGVIPCPCGNAPGGAGKGCNNSLGTGGASISATGTASLSADTVVITAVSIGSSTSSCAGSSTSLTCILLQGDANLPAGIAFNDGVRCFGGNLKRIQAAVSASGVFSSTGSISAASAALGDTIAPGTSRFYGVWYRDPCSTFACAAPSNSNVSNGLAILWAP